MEEEAGGASTAADAEGGPASSSQERDTVKYFLGGLSWDTNEVDHILTQACYPADAVRQHFQQFGRISEAIVMRDRVTGEARGFGFVTVEAAAADTVERSEHIIGGRKIDLKRSLPHPKKTRKIFVGGLGADVDDDMLKQYFEGFGAIDEAQVMFDHTTGRSRGFGFVTFEDDSAVERVFGAGRMHTIGGKSVEVKPATPRGSGPTGLAMGRGFAMVLPGRGMTRGGFAEMAPATAAAYPGGPYQGYAGMVPYATGGRLQPMGIYGGMSAAGMAGYAPYPPYAMMLQQQMQMQQQLGGGGGMGGPAYGVYGAPAGAAGPYDGNPYAGGAARSGAARAAPGGAAAYGFSMRPNPAYPGYLQEGDPGAGQGYDPQQQYAAYQQTQPPVPVQRNLGDAGWPPREYRQ